jgi:hypothetical protein
MTARDQSLNRARALIVRRGGATRELTQVTLRSRDKDEAWLRDLIFAHPELLPVAEYWGQFAPLIPLGTEIASMDALFISPGGYLTILETKLVDNPEDRRRVLAQVVDYARYLATWSAEDLAREVHSRSVGNKPGSVSVGGTETKDLYEYVRSRAVAAESALSGPDAEPSPVDYPEQRRAFLTSLQRNLEHARFLLLVVGERDLARIQDLTDTIQHSSFLQFSLAVLEIATFELAPGTDDELLIVPRIVIRTQEVRRSIARIEVGPPLKISYPGPSEVAAVDSGVDRRRTRPISDDDFFDHLNESGQAQFVPHVRELIDFLRDDERIALRPTSTGVSVRLPNPRNQTELMTLFWLDLKGLNFYYLRLHARRMQLSEFLVDGFYAAVGSAFQMGIRPIDARNRVAKEVAAPYPNIVPFAKLAAGITAFETAISTLVAGVNASSTAAGADDVAAPREP